MRSETSLYESRTGSICLLRHINRQQKILKRPFYHSKRRLMPLEWLSSVGRFPFPSQREAASRAPYYSSPGQRKAGCRSMGSCLLDTWGLQSTITGQVLFNEYLG